MLTYLPDRKSFHDAAKFFRALKILDDTRKYIYNFRVRNLPACDKDKPAQYVVDLIFRTFENPISGCTFTFYGSFATDPAALIVAIPNEMMYRPPIEFREATSAALWFDTELNHLEKQYIRQKELEDLFEAQVVLYKEISIFNAPIVVAKESP